MGLSAFNVKYILIYVFPIVLVEYFPFTLQMKLLF